jgi:hypothetical protein
MHRTRQPDPAVSVQPGSMRSFPNSSSCSSGVIGAQGWIGSTGSSGYSFVDAGQAGKKHSWPSRQKPSSDGIAPDSVGTGI